MTNGVIVNPLGNGEYRVTFPQPIPFTMSLGIQGGSHKIRFVPLDESRESIIGVEGEKDTLLSWLRSLGSINSTSMKALEDLMTE